MVLTGSFSRTLDEKLRVAIPKEFRDVLRLPAAAALFVAPGTDGSLALYTEEVFARLAERLGDHSPTRREVRSFSRLFYAQARRVELDRQGRIRIPAELAERAGIEKDVVLLGVQDRMELWDRSRWEMWLVNNEGEYDTIAEAAFESGDLGSRSS